MLLLCTSGIAHDGTPHDNQPDVDRMVLKPDSVAASKKQEPWGRNYFPNVTLVTQEGEKVRFFDDLIDGKVVAVNFIYTSCEDSCPLETAQLKRVYDILGSAWEKTFFLFDQYSS